MTIFRFQGIAESVAAEVRETMRSPGYGHPAHREVAHGYGPCRLCLRTFDVGREERILFTYQPFSDPGSLPAPGPVFIHSEQCARYDGVEFPPQLRALPLVFEAYRCGGQLLARERVTGPVESALEQLFASSGADYVHIRNGDAGCFMAAVQRLGR